MGGIKKYLEENGILTSREKTTWSNRSIEIILNNGAHKKYIQEDHHPAIILLVLVLLISGVIFWKLRFLKAELGDHWKDYANAFTMQTAASKDLPSLENIDQYKIDVQFISKEEIVESRPIHLYVPENASQPMP